MILTLENVKRSTGSKNKSVNPISLGEMIPIPPYGPQAIQVFGVVFPALCARQVGEYANVTARQDYVFFFHYFAVLCACYDSTGMKKTQGGNEREKASRRKRCDENENDEKRYDDRRRLLCT